PVPLGHGANRGRITRTVETYRQASGRVACTSRVAFRNHVAGHDGIRHASEQDVFYSMDSNLKGPVVGIGLTLLGEGCAQGGDAGRQIADLEASATVFRTHTDAITGYVFRPRSYHLGSAHRRPGQTVDNLALDGNVGHGEHDEVRMNLIARMRGEHL